MQKYNQMDLLGDFNRGIFLGQSPTFQIETVSLSVAS
jgi:hypothetical protein